MFERFTERARQVVVLAQDEARSLEHNYIGTEHLLLGLLRERESLGARVLESLDITVEKARGQIERIVGRGTAEIDTGQIPFTPHAKKALELSLERALSLGHNYIGTEHVLLGVVGVEEGVATTILHEFATDAEKVHDQVIRMLSGPPHRVEQALTGPEDRGPASLDIPEGMRDTTLGELVEAIRSDKDAAIDNQDFERASAFRDAERWLVTLALDLEQLADGYSGRPGQGT